MKTTHDANDQDVGFTIGAWVWLRLNQHVALSVGDGAYSKLAPRFFEPYQVLERVGPLAYKLQLPPKAKIHNVFHVAFLKQFVGTPMQQTPALPHIVRGHVVPQLEQLTMACRTSNSWDVLVKWQGQPTGKATWESLHQFKEDYLEFQLEDELFCQAGRNVVDQFFAKQYVRKNKKSTA
jgi:hypothetical protein